MTGAGCLALGAGQASASQVGCGDTITADTKLHSDLINCPNNGISIGADDITLDLNGHAIDGDGTLVNHCGAHEACDTGVDNTAGYSGVTIEGGSIRQFAFGVFAFRAADNRLQRLSASQSFFAGVVVVRSTGGQLERLSTFENGLTTEGTGIVLFRTHRSRVERSFTSDNGDSGLFVGNSGHLEISGNSVSGNPIAGIVTDTVNRSELSHNRLARNGDQIIVIGDENVVSHNFMADAQPFEGGCGLGISLEGGADNLVERNMVAGTCGNGIRLDAFAAPTTGTVVRGNVVRDAGVDGIAVNPEHVGPVADTLLERNVVIAASDDGIDVESATATLTRNHAVRNGDLGIEAIAGVSDGGGNHAAANGDPAQCTNVACK